MTQSRRDFLALAVGASAFVGAFAPAIPASAAAEAYATGDMALGPENAPITIIEYASMTCPHCAAFHNDTFAKLKAEYIDTGKVRFIYREFPLDQPALRAAMLARCAGRERFFGFIEVLFRQQDYWARANDPIKALAKIGRMGGVGQRQFDACIQDRALEYSILKTEFDAQKEFDINSTPTFIINGKKHPGAMTLEQFGRVLKPLLP